MARQRMAEVRAELAELEAAESFFEAPPDEEGEFEKDYEFEEEDEFEDGEDDDGPEEDDDSNDSPETDDLPRMPQEDSVLSGVSAHLLEDILQMAGDDIGDFSDDPSKRTSAFTVDRPSSYTSEVTGASRPPSSPWREGPSSPWREEDAPLVDPE